MRAQAVRDELDRRKLSTNAAALRLGMSRETVTKMKHGHSVELQVIEKFARELKLNVNDWRKMWGYEPIMDPQEGKPPLERIDGTVPELTYDPDLENARISGQDGCEQLDAEEMETLNRLYRAYLTRHRRKNEGREPPPA